MSHSYVISKSLNDPVEKYDVILLGDFNTEPKEKNIWSFLNYYYSKNIIKQKTYFKNPDGSTCINLILNNSSGSFQDICTIGLSDFHKLVVTVLTFLNKNPIFIPSETIKDSKMIYLDRNLIMSYPNLMDVTLSIFSTFLMKFWIGTNPWKTNT